MRVPVAAYSVLCRALRGHFLRDGAGTTTLPAFLPVSCAGWMVCKVGIKVERIRVGVFALLLHSGPGYGSTEIGAAGNHG